MARPVADMIDNQLQSALNEVPNEIEHFHELGERLLRKIITENRNPTHSEKIFFQSRLAWDDAAVRSQQVRLRNVMRNEAIVGTAAQREAMAEEKLKAQETLKSEGPKLDAKIEALQSQKNALERAASQAEKRSEQIGLAVAEITKIDSLRPDRYAAYQQRRLEFAETFWTPMNALGTEIRFRELMLNPSTPVENLIEAARLQFPDCVLRNQYNNRFELVEPNWSNRKQTLRNELIEMRIEFAKYEAIKAEQMTELDGLCNFYLEAIG